MNLIEITGWIVVASLVIVLIAQSGALRRFTRPRRVDATQLPALTVVIGAVHDEISTRHTVSSVTALDYPGSIEILLIPTSQGIDLRSLALASSRARVLDDSSTNEMSWKRLASDSNSEWFLVLRTPLQLEPDAASRLVAQAALDDLDVCVLFPRLEVGFGMEMLTTPMVPWLSLTFSWLAGGSSPTLSSTAAGALLVSRSTCKASESTLDACLVIEPAMRFSTLDGFDSVRRGPFTPRETLEGLAFAAGNVRGRVTLLATLLPLLFTAPVAVAIATKTFVWIVAAVISYWIRFRVAARSGEAIPAAFLHPVSAFIASFQLFRWSNRSDLRNHE